MFGKAALSVLAVAFGVLTWYLVALRNGTESLTAYRVDMDVYRVGARVFLSGGELYGELPALAGGGHMPFTYPPFAAVGMAVLAVVSYPVASALTVVTSLVALVVVLVVVSRALNVSPWPVTGLLLAGAVVLEPVRTTLDYGQVNLVLMALVALDCLVRTPRWPRGALIGIAAAIKLTPVLFVLLPLLRGDRRAVLVAGVSFLAAAVVGLLLAPADSVRYWTSTVFDPDRIGNAGRPTNQSIKGLLARLGIESTALWLLLAVVVLALTAVAVRRALAVGRPVLALGGNAVGILLVSPVSWCHHWVWVVPLLLTGGVHALRTRSRPMWTVVGGVAVLFVLSPHWWLSGRASWTWPQLLLVDGYVLAGVVLLAVAAIRRRVPGGTPAPRLLANTAGNV